MKKHSFLLCFLCMILLVSVLAVNFTAEAFADGNEEVATLPENAVPVITVASVTAEAGETVRVPIRFDLNANEKGVCGATIRLSLDSKLKLLNVQAGTAFSTLVFTKPGSYLTSYPVLLWDGMEDVSNSGEIAVLTFVAPETAGVYEIVAGCEPGDMIDSSLNDISVAFVSGSVTVESDEDYEPDLVLPAELERIEDESFEGGAFTCVQLSENVTYIGKRAFADCPNLKHISIPDGVSTIEDDAFEGVDGLTIHGSNGSLAEEYAAVHGFAFRGK